jgi:hypothetical protein
VERSETRGTPKTSVAAGILKEEAATYRKNFIAAASHLVTAALLN